MRGEADNLFVGLVDALAQLGFLPSARRAAQIEQLHLGRHNLRDVRHIDLAHEFLGKLDALGAVALGRQARLAGGELGQSLGHDREIGARDGVVEPHQQVAGLDAVAVLDAQLADHAAGRVLDLLDVRFNDDRARRDQRAGDLDGGGPDADAERQENDDRNARDRVAPDGFARAPWLRRSLRRVALQMQARCRDSRALPGSDWCIRGA